MKVYAEDLAGRQFGRVTVLEKVGRSSGRIAIYHCRCECGTEFDAYASNLKSGRTRSCGCLRREQNIARITITPEDGET